jgi:membrane-bound ClpP family serine protease
MRKVLQVLLLLIAIVMLYLGIAKAMLPPVLTGVAIILILLLFKTQKTDGNN